MDLPARQLAIDGVGPAWRYVYDNGQLSFHEAAMRDNPPRELDAFESMTAELLAELDAGLANSTWTAEAPPTPEQFASHSALYGSEWWRVDLPMTWASDFRVYMLLRNKSPETCLFNRLLVLHANADEVVKVRHPHHHTTWELNVELCGRLQWEPDWSASQLAPPFSGRTYRWRSVDRFEYGEYP
jgi:hypothetical protein